MTLRLLVNQMRGDLISDKAMFVCFLVLFFFHVLSCHAAAILLYHRFHVVVIVISVACRCCEGRRGFRLATAYRSFASAQWVKTSRYFSDLQAVQVISENTPPQ